MYMRSVINMKPHPLINSHECNILEDSIYMVVLTFVPVELLVQWIEVGGADLVAVATYLVAAAFVAV